MKKTGFVYLISDGDYFKIGHTSKSIKIRLSELQVGNPNELFIIDSYETTNYKLVELTLHRLFKNNHILGEWFELNSNQTKEFTNKCKSIETQLIIN